MSLSAGLPSWPTRSRLLGCSLFLRDVFRFHFGFVPMQEKSGIWIVRNQSPSEMDGAVFFDARSFRLADHFHIHVWRRRGIKFRIAGHKSNLQHDWVAGSYFDHLARNFRKLQPAGGKPRQLALI